jgi:endonuclease YncB( thermonuclease family)
VEKMKPIFLFFVLICFAATAENSFSADFSLNQILDGDSLEVITGKGERIIVHLAGIDAPEMPIRKSEKGQPFCKHAQKMLSDLVVNKQFSFQAESRLINHQVLAIVYCDSKNVNLEMIKAGLAETYKAGALAPEFDMEPYKKEEEASKKLKKGMWALGQVYMSPSEWRAANTKSP